MYMDGLSFCCHRGDSIQHCMQVQRKCLPDVTYIWEALKGLLYVLGTQYP